MVKFFGEGGETVDGFSELISKSDELFDIGAVSLAVVQDAINSEELLLKVINQVGVYILIRSING